MKRVSALVVAAIAGAPAAAERIELRDGDMTVSAPSEIDCEAPPEFLLEGAGSALFAADRTALDTLVSQLASGLAASCEDVESLRVRGSDRGVDFSFEITRDNGWRLDGPVAAEPEPVPAAAASTEGATGLVTLPEPSAPPAPPVAEIPEPEPEPPIEPGLDFATFTSIFGSVPTVRGHVGFDNSEIWSRVLAARMYARNPGILANDLHAIELLGQMATQPEYVQVLGPLANRQPRQMSVFERRDVAQRIRTQLSGGLDQRRQTGPILVYNSVGLQLGEYDFASGTFPLSNIERVREHRQVAWKNASVRNAFSNVVLPVRLSATQEQARQLDAYLRSRNDMTLYLAVFAEIDPVLPRSLSDHGGRQFSATNTKVTQIALFADRGLSQVLYDFTSELAEAQARADVATAALNQALSSGEDMIAAIDAVNGSAAATTTLAEIFARNDWTGTGESAEVRRATALASVSAASPARAMRLAGNLRVGSYDPVRKVLPVERLSLQGLQFTTLQANAGFRVDLVPTLAEIPVDPAVASLIVNSAQGRDLEFRLDATLMQGSHTPQGADYMAIQAILKPEHLQLFGGRQNYNGAPRPMVLDLDLPESTSAVPSLMDALTPPQ